MTYLQWKQIDLADKKFEVVSQDENFAYRLMLNEGNTSVSGFGIHGTVRLKWLSLAIRARHEVVSHFVPIPRILITTTATQSKHGEEIEEKVLKKDPYFKNRIWSKGKPAEMLIAVEQWLSDYGYLNIQINSEEESNNGSTFNFFE